MAAVLFALMVNPTPHCDWRNPCLTPGTRTGKWCAPSPRSVGGGQLGSQRQCSNERHLGKEALKSHQIRTPEDRCSPRASVHLSFLCHMQALAHKARRRALPPEGDLACVGWQECAQPGLPARPPCLASLPSLPAQKPSAPLEAP